MGFLNIWFREFLWLSPFMALYKIFDRRKRYNRVVLVKFKEPQVQLVGFVTQEDITQLPLGMTNTEMVAVYLPMSYQIGGYLVFVPKSNIEPVELSIEDASRLILTAGMSTSHSLNTSSSNKN